MCLMGTTKGNALLSGLSQFLPLIKVVLPNIHIADEAVMMKIPLFQLSYVTFPPGRAHVEGRQPYVCGAVKEALHTKTGRPFRRIHAFGLYLS